ncbi:hypothetical protein GW17_00029549 [Ensete ventricosum]|nr:hypothetical protein GW17_00029549 [Ensete ventricosum]
MSVCWRIDILPVVSGMTLTALLYQPFHLELNFFNKENRVVQYPVRAFYLDSFNLMAYNISSGADNLYKKLYSTVQITLLFSSATAVSVLGWDSKVRTILSISMPYSGQFA